MTSSPMGYEISRNLVVLRVLRGRFNDLLHDSVEWYLSNHIFFIALFRVEMFICDIRMAHASCVYTRNVTMVTTEAQSTQKLLNVILSPHMIFIPEPTFTLKLNSHRCQLTRCKPIDDISICRGPDLFITASADVPARDSAWSSINPELTKCKRVFQQFKQSVWARSLDWWPTHGSREKRTDICGARKCSNLP